MNDQTPETDYTLSDVDKALNAVGRSWRSREASESIYSALTSAAVLIEQRAREITAIGPIGDACRNGYSDAVDVVLALRDDMGIAPSPEPSSRPGQQP